MSRTATRDRVCKCGLILTTKRGVAWCGHCDRQHPKISHWTTCPECARLGVNRNHK